MNHLAAVRRDPNPHCRHFDANGNRVELPPEPTGAGSRRLTFGEAVAHLMASGCYAHVDMGSPPAEKNSTRAPDNVWTLLTDGDEMICHVWCDASGRYIVE
jgi:hypothetical protein